MRDSSRVFASVVLTLGAAFAAPASAQVAVIVPGSDECTRLTHPCDGSTDCTESLGVPSSCVTLTSAGGSTGRYCVPDVSFFCCSSETACPDARSCRTLSDGGVGVCAAAGHDYCSDDRLATVACHRAPGGLAPVPYGQGDCDGDGITNGREVELGSDVCTAPPERMGVYSGTSCLVGVFACERPGEACLLEGAEGSAVCTLSDDTGDAAPLCSVPPDVFCCGGLIGLSCPGELVCVTDSSVDDGFGFCSDFDVDCGPDRVVACHTAASGDFPVPTSQGDCDADGRSNETDPAPCVPEADAGPPTEDAGPLEDAGAGIDAGTAGDAAVMDGGAPSVVPHFGGGGGCACHVGGARPGPAPWILTLGCLALLARFRKR